MIWEKRMGGEIHSILLVVVWPGEERNWVYYCIHHSAPCHWCPNMSEWPPPDMFPRRQVSQWIFKDIFNSWALWYCRRILVLCVLIHQCAYLFNATISKQYPSINYINIFSEMMKVYLQLLVILNFPGILVQ